MEQPVMPSNDAILAALRASGPGRPLALREVYLRSLGKDPRREQMGSGVKKGMNQSLTALKRRGLVTSPSDGLWLAT
ncbi:unnamed protein product [Polarella glacialis]|uniref:Uncharacterized protein n=1 Tax=Polarella glacialis TaxID=89957 RepID=A0A813JMT6_POLGL|nr:unnamed protein product [Polarella glacialis]